MARAAATKTYNSFVAGLVTDASEVNFPENASVDENNFKLLIDGSRKVRRGASLGSAYKVVTGVEGLSRGEWRTAGGNSSYNFEVVKVGGTVHFYKQVGEDLSSNPQVFTIDLTSATYKVSTATTSQITSSPVQFSYGKGYLFIVGKYIEPTYVTFDPDTEAFTATTISITERDIYGVDDGLEAGEKPATLTATHAYNLKNQGWSDERITAYRTAKAVYPSNAQIAFAGKYTNVSTGQETWSADQLDQIDFGNTLAPRGRYIRNVFSTTQSFSLVDSRAVLPATSYNSGTSQITVNTDSAHGIAAASGSTVTFRDSVFRYVNTSALPSDINLDGVSFTEGTDLTVVDADTFTITYAIADYSSSEEWATAGYVEVGTITNPTGYTLNTRPQAVAFFAGRIWYAGIEEQEVAGSIYFSQLIKDTRDLGRCYQEADPTAEEINELVATDGGVVPIPEIGQVKRLLATSDSLVAFADNGVWIISGGSGYFTATEYAVRNILKDPFSSPDSVVFADGMPIFWTDTGIFTLQQDRVTGFLSPTNISQGVIQSYLNDIPRTCVSKVSGSYNPLNKTVVWTYSLDSDNPTKHSTVLNLDSRLQAYYKYSIDTSTNSYPSFFGSGVCINTINEDKKIQFLTLYIVGAETRLSWSTLSNTTDLEDWSGSFDLAYTGYLTAGYELLGDLLNEKQATYVRMFFKKTEENWVSDGAGGLEFDHPSSCYVQGRWAWTTSGDFGRWNNRQQAYRLLKSYTEPATAQAFDYGIDVISTKLKMRGRGTCLSLRFETEAGKDCHILGWAVPFTSTSAA